MTWLRPAAAIAAKDLRVEAKTRDVVLSVGLLVLLVVVTASFAIPIGERGQEGAAAGVLWLSFLFAALLGMGRSMAQEKEESCLDGLLVSPAPREAIFLGKFVSNLCFTGTVEALMVPLFVGLMGLSVARPGLLVISIALGTIGIIAVGTLLSAMAVATRGREAILPLLVLPVSVPVVTAAVKTTEAAVAGGRSGATTGWLILMVVYDVLFVLVALATFPFVTEE